MPNARTATIAVSRVRMTGRSEARTMSQPEVAVRAMPEAVAMPPSRPPRTVPAEGHQTLRDGLAVRGDGGSDAGSGITGTRGVSGAGVLIGRLPLPRFEVVARGSRRAGSPRAG